MMRIRFRPARLLALGAAAASSLAAGCLAAGDETPPRIVEPPSASVVRDTTATIAWLTDERANSGVEYGTDTTYGTVEIDDLYLTSHVITIRNLQPQTTYHLRAMSYDVFGNGPTRSDDLVITTLPPQLPPDVQITEVMYNPVSETTGEFVEIYNNGTDDVELTGFTLSDGDSIDTLKAYAGGSTLLPAGAYAVILDPDYVESTYNIPAGTVLLTTNDASVGNGLSPDDPLELFAPGETTAISSYGTPLDTADGVPITTAPDGSSVERRDPSAPDSASNWCVSVDPSGSTPGTANSGC